MTELDYLRLIEINTRAISMILLYFGMVWTIKMVFHFFSNLIGHY